MHIDVSLLPALGATFMLVFARVGSMVMLLPALGETNIPANIKVALAVMLTLIILPLHRADYKIDLDSMNSVLVLMLHEIIVGVVLGATAKVTFSALQVGGSVIAQQMGLGFVTSVDPTQGEQGVLVGNFLTMLGVALNFAPVNPIQALFWSAVVNGVVAVPIMVIMMLMTRRRDVMGAFVLPPVLHVFGWLATAAMGATVIALVVTSLMP